MRMWCCSCDRLITLLSQVRLTLPFVESSLTRNLCEQNIYDGAALATSEHVMPLLMKLRGTMKRSSSGTMT